jgi:DNA-binding response OmpR family regulator
MATHILFVGRQPDSYAPLWRHLLLSNVQVSFAASQARALRELDTAGTDVIVLDAVSLRMSPEPLARVLRQRAPSARIVLIAENKAPTGYSYDYLLPNPVTWHRLLKVIEEALASERRQVLAKGPFVLDLVERTIVGPAGEARLTSKLFGLLALLMRNAGQTISRHQIMQEIWHTSYLEDTRTLDVHMSWLRGLIEPQPKQPLYLRTKRGVGYVFLPYGATEELSTSGKPTSPVPLDREDNQEL